MPDERIYTIPLRRAGRVPCKKHARRAVKLAREFLERHMKSDQVKLDSKLNSRIWARGAEHPPSRVRVRAVKQDDGSVEAFLAE